MGEDSEIESEREAPGGTRILASAFLCLRTHQVEM